MFKTYVEHMSNTYVKHMVTKTFVKHLIKICFTYVNRNIR